MKKDITELGSVIVTAQKPLLTRSVDKLTLNIEGSIYEKGENGLRLFNIIPGVIVSGNDINFRGSESVTVFVDNRKVLLSGEQLFIYLRSIPSESIKSYELKTVPGAEIDAQNNGVVINIILKSEYRYGFSGNISSGYWYNGYSNAMGSSQLNYKAGKLTIQTGFNYRRAPAFYKDNIEQEFKRTGVYSPQIEQYVEKYNSISYNLGLDFKITEKQVLGANYNMFTNPGDFDNTTTTNIKFLKNRYPNTIDSSLYTMTKRKFSYVNHMANVFYRKKLDSLGSKLDVGYSYIYYNMKDPSAIETRFFNNNDIEFRKRDSLFTKNKGRSNISVVNIDLEKYLSQSFVLTAGGKYAASKTDYTMDYRNGLSEKATLDSLRSNRFLYDEKIMAIYGTIAKSFNNWQMKLGLRAEHTQYTGNSVTTGQTIGRNRWDLFPSAYINRKIGNIHSITLSYARRIDRPGFRQLNPFITYTSLNYRQEGNPDLLPYYSNNLQVEYLLRSKYSATLGYQNTLKGIVSNVRNVGDVIIAKDENISNSDNIFLTLYIPVKLTKWWEVNTNATLRHSTLKIQTTPVVDRSKFSQSMWATSKFILPGKYFIELSGVYNRNNFSGIYDARDVGKIDITIRKSFLNDRLNTRVEIQDPFHLFKPGSIINTNEFTRTSIREKLNWSRYIGFWVTYNFSTGKKQTSRENIEVGGNEIRNRL